MENIRNQAQKHLEVIRALQASSGLFLASSADVTTGYDKAWIRDNFYTTLGFEQMGEWETVERTWRAILDLFIKHKDKINWAAENRPHESYQYIHARFHPETFEEFWEEWGNKQNDAVGASLYKFALLEQTGHSVVKSDEDRAMIQTLVNYLNSVEYWHDPDNGVWEEYEEIHASSIAPVLGALYKIQSLDFVEIPEGMIEKGEDALRELLPRESETKFTDLALLSLMYPYNVITASMSEKILANVEYHLAKKSGVIRYKTDRYYNKNEVDGWSEEAEWTMGFPWLSIIYSNLGNKEKAGEYLEKTKKVLTAEDLLPELYYSNSDRPNENTPLGWAESLYVVALLLFEKNFSDEK
jgi:GH15 family glucan-1,4-alpha-glucosidase